MRETNPFLTEENMLECREEMLARVRETLSRYPQRYRPARQAPHSPPIHRKRGPSPDPLREAKRAAQPACAGLPALHAGAGDGPLR